MDTQFRQYGHYLPWEHGYYEPSGHYMKNGVTIFCYTHYFSGKSEQVETQFLIDCSKVNDQIRETCN